jgi:hypothetical protein
MDGSFIAGWSLTLRGKHRSQLFESKREFLDLRERKYHEDGVS